MSALKEIFERLGANAEKFASGAPTNVNESLNASMASYAPKSRCYSMTSAADHRFAFTVASKNLGPRFTQAIVKPSNLSPGKYHS